MKTKITIDFSCSEKPKSFKGPGPGKRSQEKVNKILNYTKKHVKKFWDNIKVKEEDECWFWIGTMQNDTKGEPKHGKFSIKNVLINPSRFSYLLHFGEYPGELFVCHTCDEPNCCNPKHLFLDTHDGNMKDKVKKGRQYHPTGVKNTMAKLNDDKVREIRKLYATGKYSHKDIAKKFDVSRVLITKVLQGKIWDHVR